MEKKYFLPLFKKGDKQNPKYYRGINLLNTWYKIFKKIINEKLKQYSEKCLPTNRNGFRKGPQTILTEST
jgi:hypothetical protein